VRALDAVDRHLASHAAPPAVPGEPPIPWLPQLIAEPTRTLFQCPSWCLRGLPIHSEGCPNRPPADPTGAEPGTGKPPACGGCENPVDCTRANRCLRQADAGTGKGR
jgi:hypothetical protein